MRSHSFIATVMRRRAFTQLLALVLAACASNAPATSAIRLAGAATSASEASARAVATIGMTVADMDRSVAFYTGVLSFVKTSDTVVSGAWLERLTTVPDARARLVRLALGDEVVELTQFLGSTPRAVPEDSRSNDGWFQHVAIVVRDMDSAYAVLQAHGVARVSPTPQLLPAWNPNAGGIAAFYFLDPDRHVLEVIHFPAGKGLAKWQLPAPRLFLGIDHTAIVVADTRASLDFYEGVLGLHVAGRSENYGPEQEQLNDVAGAHLRITSMRAASGPGIEFLQYLAPRGGRPYPADERPTDLVHWQTTIVVGSANAAANALRAAERTFITPGAVALPAGNPFTNGFLARDPDGHVLQIVQR